MKAGTLRHFVTFDVPRTDRDADGQPVVGWVPAFGGQALPAEIKALSGGELIEAQAVQSRITTRMKLRYRAGFLPIMRAVHAGVPYNVEAVIPDPGSGIEFVTLLCSSGLTGDR